MASTSCRAIESYAYTPRRARVAVAESQREVTLRQMEQAQADFDRDATSSDHYDAVTWRKARSFDGKLQEWFWSWFGEMF